MHARTRELPRTYRHELQRRARAQRNEHSDGIVDASVRVYHHRAPRLRHGAAVAVCGAADARQRRRVWAKRAAWEGPLPHRRRRRSSRGAQEERAQRRSATGESARGPQRSQSRYRRRRRPASGEQASAADACHARASNGHHSAPPPPPWDGQRD